MRVNEILAIREEHVTPDLMSTTDSVPNLPSANHKRSQGIRKVLVNPEQSITPALGATIRPTLANARKRHEMTELTRPETRSQAAGLLGQAGYRQTGPTGLYGAAYMKPDSQYVVKLFHPSDRGYLEFIKLCRAMQSPHLPVLKGQPVKVNDNYWGIRIERLKPLNAAWKPFIMVCRKFLGALSLMEVYRGHEAEGISRDPDIQKTQEFIDMFRLKQPAVAKVIDAIYTYIISKDKDLYMEDINMYNAGLRGKTLVFFDPVGTAVNSDTPGFLDSDLEEGSRDIINRLEHNKMAKASKQKIRQMKAVAMPGNTSTYPAL